MRRVLATLMAFAVAMMMVVSLSGSANADTNRCFYLASAANSTNGCLYVTTQPQADGTGIIITKIRATYSSMGDDRSTGYLVRNLTIRKGDGTFVTSMPNDRKVTKSSPQTWEVWIKIPRGTITMDYTTLNLWPTDDAQGRQVVYLP